MQELGEMVADDAYLVQELCHDAEIALDSHYEGDERAHNGLEKLRRVIDDLQGVVNDIDSGLASISDEADAAYDKVQEANSVAGQIDSFGVEIANRAKEGEPATAETEVELGGTRYRVRFDPLEEVETEDIDE